MKSKVIILVTIVMLMISSLVYAQEAENPKQVSITLYPIGLALGYYSFEGEYKLSPKLGLPLEVKYWSLGTDESKIGYLLIGPGLRYYPANKGMTGVFVGPYFNYITGNFKFTETDPFNAQPVKGEVSVSGFSFTLWFGYKIISGPIVLEVSTGVAYMSLGDVKGEWTDSAGIKHEASYSGTGGSGFGWAGLGLGVGFAF